MPDTDNHRLWLVDSSIYVFRAWYTWPDDMLDLDGNPVNATLGFLDIIRRLLTREKPAQLVFAFDESLQTSWRNTIYPPYKANREPAPENLKHQFRLCRRFVQALGFPEYASIRHEADDIIGTLARQAQERGERVCLVTGDKDLMQLLRPGDWWWEYARDKQLGYDQVERELGVMPEQVADLLALAGDKVDNIPGIPGVGMVTAAKLLRRFNSLPDLLQQTEAIGRSRMRAAKRVQKLVEEHTEELQVYQQLTEIRCDIDDELIPLEPLTDREEALFELCEYLQLHPASYEQWAGFLRNRDD